MRDYFSGYKVIDLPSGTQTAYGKSIPYKYFNPADGDIVDLCATMESALSEEGVDGADRIDGSITYRDGDEILGNFIRIHATEYSTIEWFPFVYREPDKLKELRESGIEIAITGFYADQNSDIEWVTATMRTAGRSMQELDTCELYNAARQRLLDAYSSRLNIVYWFNVKNDKVVVEFIDRTPLMFRDADVFYNRGNSHYEALKAEYYGHLVSAGLLTQDECNIITDNAPRLQKTSVRFTWESGELVKKQVQIRDVFEFEDV